jgi:hypothetical protein
MEGEITDGDRAALVRVAVSRLGRDELKEALVRTTEASFQAPKAVTNALNALRKHRDPASVVTRPQYRVALPYLAAVVADDCLSRTIEVLGDHSDDPTRDQLLEALDQVRESFSDVTIGTMLASVADGGMPASDLCFELAAEDERFGLSGWATAQGSGTGVPAAPPVERATTPEQREARRLKKQRDAEERRRKLEAARKAGEQVRRARKQERSSAAAAATATDKDRDKDKDKHKDPGPGSATAGSDGSVAPRLTRRASLTPVQEEVFDRHDPWATGVVYAWVPFDSVDPDQPELEGKSRRCVVVAGSDSELLVRPGYSEGGMKSRDWKSVPLRHWKQAGFDQPTWIDSETLEVPRPSDGPIGWLASEDWNALW